MKTLMLVLVLLSFSLSSLAQSKKSVGLGVILGDPTALSAKFFMGSNQAVDAGLSFSSRHILLYGDYLKHFPGAFGKPNAFIARLSPYLGVGPVLAFNTDNDDHRHKHYFEDEDDDFAFGARIPFGIEWVVPTFPLGISVELAPGIIVIPETDAFIQGGVAFRYYF